MDDIRYEADDLKLCLQHLREGKRILLATETGWALCASSLEAEAIGALRKVSVENSAQPLTVLVSNEAVIERIAEEVPEVAWDLLEVSDRPLTLVLDNGKNIPVPAMADTGEIAIRVCRERFYQDLITRLKAPLVCSAIAGFASLQEIPATWKKDAGYTSTYKGNSAVPFRKEYRIKLGRGGLVSILK
jgi:L-threonylcarbamoyladenylate synthase